MSGRGSPPLERQSERAMLQDGLEPFDDSGQALSRRRGRLLAGALTVTVHLMALAALLWPRAVPPPKQVRPPPPPLEVSLVELPKPKPPEPPKPVMLEPVSPHSAVRPPHLTLPVPDTSDLLSESQLAGATSAGEAGAGGGGCDMARAVQQALRRDPLVRAAVEDANRLGKAIMLWNGDWVRSGEQDGKGLSAVREAIMWEVAFAPEACRNQRVHGLVLLSLADGVTRFVIGSGDWRWSDLLGVRGAPPDR